VFVHGLNGSGYKSWQEFPRFLFDGCAGPRLDVAVYDYVTFFRRMKGRGASLRFCVRQLTHDLRELESEYSSIYLVGHSLGGMLAEAVAKEYLEAHAMNESHKLTPLAGLVLMASPRAGSAWALRPFQRAIGEFQWLHRMSPRSQETERFFSTYVESYNTAKIEPRNFLLPRYAFLAGSDRFVNEFSAGFGIPDTQKHRLSESHSSIVKPRQCDDEQVRKLLRIISDVTEVRRQWQREQRHAEARTTPELVPPPAPFIVTEFWGDTSGLQWEAIYNSVRKSSSTADLTVYDHRDAPGAVVDLLVAVSDAEKVLRDEQSENSKVMKAYNRRQANERLSVGLSPVGLAFDAAERQVNDWLHTQPMLSSIYVEGASDMDTLHSVISQWVRLVVERHPGRGMSSSSRVERLLKADDDSYDPDMIGGYL
jgi:pimeloyl-ACP methyl ester carboxylesterase